MVMSMVRYRTRGWSLHPSARQGAKGAKLEYDIAPIIITCLDCGMDSEVVEFSSLCQFCNSPDVVLKAGTEDSRIVELGLDEKAYQYAGFPGKIMCIDDDNHATIDIGGTKRGVCVHIIGEQVVLGGMCSAMQGMPSARPMRSWTTISLLCSRRFCKA